MWLTLLQQNGPWILAAVLGLVLLYLAMRPRRINAPRSPIDCVNISELSFLRNKLQEMESRYNAQIEFFIKHILQEVPMQKPVVIGTGGLAGLIGKKCPEIEVIEENLTLIGLNHFINLSKNTN